MVGTLQDLLERIRFYLQSGTPNQRVQEGTVRKSVWKIIEHSL
jgi:hypothetical protein